MTYTDLWPLIQADILGVIQADPFLGARNGVLVEPGDVQSNVEAKIATVIGPGADGKNGVGFLVLPIERAEDENPSMPFGPLRLTLTIQWCENVIVNNSPTGTKTPIRVYAALTEKILKLYTPVNLTQSLVPATPVISEFTAPANKNLRMGRVEFYAGEADDRPLNRLSRPQISVAGTGYPYTVTVTAPGAAQEYWTTDGSHPWSGNAQATLYGGPVNIAQCGLFRCRAFAPGYVASDTAAQSF